MNILIVSDFESQGGAAIAMRRITDVLARLGHSVRYVVCRPAESGRDADSAPVDVLHWRSEISLPRRIARKFLSSHRRKEAEQRLVELAFHRVLERVRPDVVNFSNIHSAVSAGWSDRLLPVASRYAPVCWTLQDMWSFTGRCAYAHDCERFITGCNAQCPTADEYPALRPELIEPAWLQRRAMFLKLPDLTAVTTSSWMAQQARRGLWQNHRVEVVHAGLPLKDYQLLDPAAARAELGINPDGPVLLAAAVDWASPHKGGRMLVDCLRTMAPLRPTLLQLGGGELPGELAGLNIVRLGFQTSQRFKAVAMSAADCLVHPASAENFSNVLLEAAACGLPAAAFEVGGNAEIITHGQTGHLSRAITGEGLAEAVARSLELRRLHPDLRQRIRDQAETRFDDQTQARAFLAVFQSLIDARAGKSAPPAAHVPAGRGAAYRA